ncbi:rap guanine nucleotide exchange factor 6-like [Sinocyclocheilus grahami]|uniref:rap guanine nucleotide exchange factor 6-like n=1 Tax=Sinocyclocheilus grahami TaxID=75366 RepID=UPI0007AC6FB4|nr:PREDICTED: rap guanine nucleotide exchange factor 6-like [Sinocyclocheilus grahami]
MFSSSAEELTVPEQTSVSELADSGRGSWTSCSSNSHDNLQTLSGQRALDLLNHRHTPMGGPIAEVEIGPGLPEDSCSRDGSELSQSRQSWTSSSSLSDTYEGSYGTIKRKTQNQQSTDASYKTITSSTEKGLIVYCVTSPCKDDRLKAPPPTPPGYQGLTLGDAQDGGASRPTHVKPPEYSVALQRCKLRHSLAEPNLSRPPSVTLHSHADSEEDEQVSAV